MSIKKWTKEEDNLIRTSYYDIGTDLSKYLDRGRNAIVKRAYLLGYKMNVIKKVKYCSRCFEPTNPYNKNILCKSCSAKLNYKKRGKFTNNNSDFWNSGEIDFITNNYYNSTKKYLINKLNRSWCSICHKANRLRLKRNIKFMNEGNRIGREYFKNNNPMHNPIFRNKAMIKQAPIFARNKMTSIEKPIAEFLDSIDVKYDFNKVVRTKSTFRFPDFKIGDLIIECDGKYWHKDRKKEDKDRQKELEEMGFNVIRFTDIEILKNFKGVKECILLKLNQ